MLNDKNERDLIEAMNKIALWLKYLGGGENASQEGAVEILAVKTKEAAELTSSAMYEGISQLTQSMDAQSNAVESAGKEIAEGLNNVAEALEKIAAVIGKEKSDG